MLINYTKYMLCFQTYNLSKITIIINVRRLTWDKKIKIKPKEDNAATFSVRVPKEMLDELEKICNQTGRSRNELINIAIEYFLKNVEIEK